MSTEPSPRKIIFAVGGTGGHLFPAQALAKEFKGENPQNEILFAGARLGTNPFFEKLQFPFREICSATPFRSKMVPSCFRMCLGVFQSYQLIGAFAPDWIVGFGSFYSFPLLAAARLRNIPYVLVELNALPGRVNRLFSAKAHLSALQFPLAAKRLKGKTALVKIPQWSRTLPEAVLSRGEVRKSFGLASDLFTILIFGGSQGAQVINEAAFCICCDIPFQVLHLCGRDADAAALKERWQVRQVRATVKPFEDKMHLAWQVADAAICRAGAGACSEMVEHLTPALMIPWSGASENHQMANAQYLERLGCGIALEEGQLDALADAFQQLIDRRGAMARCLEQMKQAEGEDLKTLIAKEMG